MVFRTNKLETNEVKIADGGIFTIPKGTEFPATPIDGQLFYRCDEHILYRYDVTKVAWVPLTDADNPMIIPEWEKIPKVAMSFFGQGKFSYDGTTLSWGPNTLKLWINNISKNITAGSIEITADYQYIYVTVDDFVTPGVAIPLNKIGYTNVNNLTEKDIIIGFVTQRGAGNEGCFHMLYALDHEHIHNGLDSHPIEGTNIASTGEIGGTKVLTENGAGGASWQDAPGGTDPNAIHDNVENEIQSIVASLTPADADVVIVEDADAVTAWSKAKLTMLNLYNYIKAKTDLLYASITHAATHQDGGADEINVGGLSGELADPQKQKAEAFSYGASNSDPTIYNGGTTYAVRRRFIFRGTNELGTPTNIKVIMRAVNAASGEFRIYDMTNATQICEGTTTSTSFIIVDGGALTNLPTGEAIFEIQLKCTTPGSPSGYVEVSGMVIQW